MLLVLQRPSAPNLLRHRFLTDAVQISSAPEPELPVQDGSADAGGDSTYFQVFKV
jgi:hypothetical protein